MSINGGHGPQQAWGLQFSELGPEHSAPPSAGAGHLHSRVRVPPPQGSEQGPQSHQPPLVGVGRTSYIFEEEQTSSP